MLATLMRRMPCLILAALAAGVAAGEFLPQVAHDCGRLGALFIGLLKAVAPVMVFFYLSAAVAEKPPARRRQMPRLLALFAVMISAAALAGVVLATVFPVRIPPWRMHGWPSHGDLRQNCRASRRMALLRQLPARASRCDRDRTHRALPWAAGEAAPEKIL